MYKLLDKGIHSLNDGWMTPFFSGSNGWEKFIADVKEHGLSIVEGADVIEPDYITLRTSPDGYASITDQLDMQYKNDGSWEAHVQAVKDKYPKTITGGTSIAPLPQWLLDLVE